MTANVKFENWRDKLETISDMRPHNLDELASAICAKRLMDRYKLSEAEAGAVIDKIVNVVDDAHISKDERFLALQALVQEHGIDVISKLTSYELHRLIINTAIVQIEAIMDSFESGLRRNPPTDATDPDRPTMLVNLMCAECKRTYLARYLAHNTEHGFVSDGFTLIGDPCECTSGFSPAEGDEYTLAEWVAHLNGVKVVK